MCTDENQSIVKGIDMFAIQATPNYYNNTCGAPRAKLLVPNDIETDDTAAEKAAKSQEI